MSEPLPPPPPPELIVGLRYSLPELLQEIQRERAHSAFASERLDQHEIGKLFKPQKRRRVTKSAQ